MKLFLAIEFAGGTPYAIVGGLQRIVLCRRFFRQKRLLKFHSAA